MIEPKTWYLGPLADIRPLTVPNPNMTTNVVRYGGVHQALSGARTLDVTGHRKEFSFDWDYLEYDEWSWLEAMHTRLLPGPFRLLNPMRRNRLTEQASNLSFQRYLDNGIRLNVGVGQWVHDPVDVTAQGHQTYLTRALEWSGLFNGAYLRMDEKHKTAILPNEGLVASIYFKGSVGQKFELVLDYYDTELNQVSSSSSQITCTGTDWERAWLWNETPAGVASVQLALIAKSDETSLRIAGPQLERDPDGGEPTMFQVGGAAPTVLMDQLTTSSPRFPLTNCSMTLLEA